MRNRSALLAAAIFAAGCATYTPSDSGGRLELNQARRSLASGRTDVALLQLEKVRLIYRGPYPQYVTLLTAEARLRQDEASEALTLAREALDADPADPLAQEVAGKALVKLGRFDEAQSRFETAQAAYPPGSPDFQRIEDFLGYARGLGAYARADPELAYQHWNSMTDPQLRFAIDRAVRAEAE